MMEKLKIEVLTPEKALPLYEGNSVNAPGIYGYFEVLPNHAPYITELDVGTLKVDDKTYFVAGGYLEVANNEVKVLADILEEASIIDAKRAEDAKARAWKRLEDKSSGDDNIPLDMERAQLSFKRAQARIDFKNNAGK